MKQKLIDFFKKRETIVALISLVVFGVLLAVDLVTKGWAQRASGDEDGTFLFTFIPGLISFRYVKNTGMAFSWLEDNEDAMTVVTIFTVVLIVALVALFFTVFRRNTPARITLAVIEAGAIGNLIDRLALGYVRDMVDVSPLGFGVCNFADFFITFGGVALLVIIAFIGKDSLFPLTKKWREEAKAEEEKKEALKAAADHATEAPSAQAPETPVAANETRSSSPEEGNNEPKHDE